MVFCWLLLFCVLMSARPTIIGTKILPEACGLRAMPARAEPAARPWPSAPPRGDRPMASAAASPSHLSRSARIGSVACANAGEAASKTIAAKPAVTTDRNNFDGRRILRLLYGCGFAD